MPGRYEAPRPPRTPRKSSRMHPVLAAIVSVLFALAGILASVSVIFLSIRCVDTKPILLTPPEAALEQLKRKQGLI